MHKVAKFCEQGTIQTQDDAKGRQGEGIEIYSEN